MNESCNRLPKPQFMIVPSLDCPANCMYCFGPSHGPKMAKRQAENTVRFIQDIVSETGMENIKITFHGGEPLVAGHEFFRQFLEKLDSVRTKEETNLAIQSNLWLLDDAYCQIFKEYNVSIGTSLDGPEIINDLQRGKGYFKNTMAGIDRARSNGLDVGCIATFTKKSIPFYREITDFFISEQLSFSVHTYVPSMKASNEQFALTTNEKADLNSNLLEYYIENRKKIAISTFDQMAKSILEGQGHICTYKDCLGMFLAIDPQGNIYPCQRFCGFVDYHMGNLDDRPTAESLFNAPIARRMKVREELIVQACGDCEHLAYCRGGCCFNAWASGDSTAKDPYCEAYAKTFTNIQKYLIQEMGSEENIAAVASFPLGEGMDLLLKKGPLIDIVRSGLHPSKVARNAKRVVAAVEFAKGPDIVSVAKRLTDWDICSTQDTCLASLEHLKQSFKPATMLNNLYLHLTLACQLECSHCYARGEADTIDEISPFALEKLIEQAIQVGFRQVILTGGEPLMHSERQKMLYLLKRIKTDVRTMNLVLRTNFAMSLSECELEQIIHAVHQVVVSIDGDIKSHDLRRGKGSYVAAVANMEKFQQLARSVPDAAELSIAAVLPSRDVEGEQGNAVRKLSERLSVRRIRFRPLLPLGRAAAWNEPPQSEAHGAHLDPLELIKNGFKPIASCGIGQNLYVEPSGDSFPCYAYHHLHAFLGNVLKEGLAEVVNTEVFQELSRHTVDTNHTCRHCDYRYLCGGACRAWGGDATQRDLDAPPLDCTGLKQSAVNLYNAACAYLEIENRAQ